MSERKNGTTRLTVSLDEENYAALRTTAEKSEVSLSWVIQQAIQWFVLEHGPHLEFAPPTLHRRGRPEAREMTSLAIFPSFFVAAKGSARVAPN